MIYSLCRFITQREGTTSDSTFGLISLLLFTVLVYTTIPKEAEASICPTLWPSCRTSNPSSSPQQTRPLLASVLEAFQAYIPSPGTDSEHFHHHCYLPLFFGRLLLGLLLLYCPLSPFPLSVPQYLSTPPPTLDCYLTTACILITYPLAYTLTG
ncbi:hypothetical protein GGR55DRAFT_208072 [Xylaria sp. FL0064]|nr:hypothetical protein GGR55DRAFT_208072 [Xylaria sp. FL0064]